MEPREAVVVTEGRWGTTGGDSRGGNTRLSSTRPECRGEQRVADAVVLVLVVGGCDEARMGRGRGGRRRRPRARQRTATGGRAEAQPRRGSEEDIGVVERRRTQRSAATATTPNTAGTGHATLSQDGLVGWDGTRHGTSTAATEGGRL